MIYLFLQIWVWLFIAFALGWVAHWFICCRNKQQINHTHTPTTNIHTAPSKTVNTTSIAPTTTVIAGASNEKTDQNAIDKSWKPEGFSHRPTEIDDLKRIKGVGTVIEKTLHELGIYQFDQVAKWTADNVTWVENFVAFPGRIKREGWVSQAQTLASGGTTEFSKRVDKGDIDYN